MSREKQFCTFFLDKSLFGFPVDSVQEVIPRQPMTPVPLAPACVKGLINLRGQIVTAVDLRTRMKLKAREESQSHMNVVLRVKTGLISLLVDEIGDVLNLDDTAFEEPPKVLAEEYLNLIQGVYKLEDRLLLVLDPENIATLDN